jgi:hypothetical protein
MEIDITFASLMISVNLCGYFLLLPKSDVVSTFLQFQAHVEKFFDRKIKAIQSDWGGEFRALNPILSRQGISHRISCPHTHQQQGSVERKHRHIVETGLSLLASASMPLKFWDEAFLTASFLINRLPSPVTQNKSPFEILFHHTPDYNFLKVFGCACWPHLRPYNKHKLAFQSQLCVFLGYSFQHKGYRCLHVPSSRIYISRNVIFYESHFPFTNNYPPTAPTTPQQVHLPPQIQISHSPHATNPFLPHPSTHVHPPPTSSFSPTQSPAEIPFNENQLAHVPHDMT